MSSLDAVRARFARNEGLQFTILTEASIYCVCSPNGRSWASNDLDSLDVLQHHIATIPVQVDNR